MPNLFIVPTPIGNLEDITLRSIRILEECDLILAEDTRVTKRLLNHLNISKPLLSFHAHNEHKVLDKTIERITQNTKTVLVSDAGTPGISDPGYLLIRSCIENNIKIECLPGATAIIPALILSGFPTERFVFEGFLPHKKGRQTRLKTICDETRTSVFYESPHRINKALIQLKEFIDPERKVCVAREISKLYEEVIRGNIDELILFGENHELKGEIVVVVSAV